MPFGDGEQAAEVRFGQSVVAEILFLAKTMWSGSAAEPLAPTALHERVAAFWDDDVLPWELLVVAEEAGVLTGRQDPAELESKLERGCESVALDPALRSESPRARQTIRRRLKLLHDDQGLRKRYVCRIGDIWRAYAAEWESEHLAALSRVAELCEQRKREGVSWQPLLKGSDKPSPVFEAGWERARDEGRAFVAVCAYGGSLVIDLPGMQFFAMPPADRSRVDRGKAEEISRGLKAVADPTRLTLLEMLRQQPLGVGQLATAMEVSQPTVSNHVKILRDAGLVIRSDAGGDRGKLSVDADALDRLLGEVRSFVGAVPDSGPYERARSPKRA